MKQAKKVKYLQNLGAKFDRMISHHMSLERQATIIAANLRTEHDRVMDALDLIESGQKVSMKRYPLFKKKHKKRVNTCAK